MTNHTIATPITTWADLRSTDREVLNRAEVATLLAVDPRTVDHAIDDGTLPCVRFGRRVLTASGSVSGTRGAPGPCARLCARRRPATARQPQGR